MESTVSVAPAAAAKRHSKDRPYPTYAQYMRASRPFLSVFGAGGRAHGSFIQLFLKPTWGYRSNEK